MISHSTKQTRNMKSRGREGWRQQGTRFLGKFEKEGVGNKVESA